VCFLTLCCKKGHRQNFCKFCTHSKIVVKINISRTFLHRDLRYNLLFSGLFFFFSWPWGLWRGGPWWKLCLWIPHRSKTVRQAREENSRNSQDANVCYSTRPFYQYNLYQPFLTGFVQYFVDCCYLYNVMVVSSFCSYRKYVRYISLWKQFQVQYFRPSWFMIFWYTDSRKKQEVVYM